MSRLKVCILLSAVCILSQSLLCEKVKIACFQLEPFMMEDPYTGEVSGITVEYWNSFLADKMGVELEFLGVFPISRAVKMLETGEAEVIPQMTKIPKREELFLYPDTILTKIVSCLIVLDDSPITDVTGKNDLSGLTIGFMEDAFIPELLIDDDIRLELVTNQDFRNINLNKLHAGRIQAVLDINYLSMKYYMRRRADHSDYRIILLNVPDEPVYSIFRRNEQGTALKARFDTANLIGIKKGIFESITGSYFRDDR